jgi:hypothetical protein
LPEGDDPVAVLRAAQAQEAKWAAAPDFDAKRHEEYGGSMLILAESVVRYLARARIAQTVVDMLEARHRDGAWPAKPPVERIDPFNDKPLRWRTDGETVTVWSVGQDGVDNGGEGRISPDVVLKATYKPAGRPTGVSSATR